MPFELRLKITIAERASAPSTSDNHYHHQQQTRHRVACATSKNNIHKCARCGGSSPGDVYYNILRLSVISRVCAEMCACVHACECAFVAAAFVLWLRACKVVFPVPFTATAIVCVCVSSSVRDPFGVCVRACERTKYLAIPIRPEI